MNNHFKTRLEMLRGSLAALLGDRPGPARAMLRQLADVKSQAVRLRDDDGLDDGEAITRFGTNPRNSDTDTDGLADRTELKIGTDPLDPDTDDDGLRDGVDPRPLQPREPGDCDGDGDFDLADFVRLASCFSGPGGGLLPGNCGCTDLDGDDDTDLGDLVAFQSRFTGAR